MPNYFLSYLRAFCSTLSFFVNTKYPIYTHMGCSQVVRQWTLTPSSVGSNPPTPVLRERLVFLYLEVLE